MESDGYVKVFSISSKQLFNSDDLVVEILSRVGQKTLLRCKAVCKNWQRLISDPSFMNRFITRLKTLPPLVVGFYYGQKKPNPSSNQKTLLRCFSDRTTDADVKFLDFPNDTHLNEKYVDTSLSFLQRKSSIIAVSSHEGFVLCAEKPISEKRIGFCELYQFRYIVCNPLTKEWVELPQPCNSHHIKLVHLFCYNNKNESNGLQTDFKVVSFVPKSHAMNKLNVDTYTSNTGKWKSSTVSTVPFPRFCTETCNVLFNGSVYFKFKTEQNLYAYDLKEEHIRCMELPHKTADCLGDDLLGVSAGSIYYARDDRKFCRIWVLDDGIGWSLQHEIDYGSLRTQIPGRCDISFRNNEKHYGFNFEPLAFHPIHHNIIFVNVVKFGGYDRALTILYHKDSGRVQVIEDLKHCNDTTVIPYSLPAWVPSLNTTFCKL